MNDTSPGDPQWIPQVQMFVQQRIEGMAPDSLAAMAWDQFHHVYSRTIGTLAVQCGAPRDEVEDCVQEVWIAVFHGLAKYQHRPESGGMRAWLFRLVRNEVLTMLRRRRRNSWSPLPDEELVPGKVELPEAAFDRRLHRELVRAVLLELERATSPLSYRVFWLRYIEQRTVGEVAQITGLSPGSVRARQHRAGRKFRALMQVYSGGDFGGS